MRNMPMILWLLMLASSLAICILFVVRVHPHPGPLLMHCQGLLSVVESSVPETERADAREIHGKVFALFRRFVGGFRESANIAGAMVIVSAIGLGVEIRRRKKIQPQPAP